MNPTNVWAYSGPPYLMTKIEKLYLIPKRLKFGLTAQIPKVQVHPVNVDITDIQTDSGRDFRRIYTFVILFEFRFRRFQISLKKKNVSVQIPLYRLTISWRTSFAFSSQLPFYRRCPDRVWSHKIRLFASNTYKTRGAVYTFFWFFF